MTSTNNVTPLSKMQEIMANLKRTQKTQKRIEEVRRELKCHAENIERLHSVAENYQLTPINEKRLQWTLHNLQTQIDLLERELSVLLAYGA